MLGLASWSACALPPPPDVSPDAGPPDAATPGDAAGGELAVLVISESAPGANVPVLLHAPDGTWLETVRTDDGGRAVLDVEAGMAITVITGQVDDPRMWTIYAVEPGDVLTFDDRRPNRDALTSATIEVTWPTPPGDCPTQLLVNGASSPVTSPATVHFSWSTPEYEDTGWFAIHCPDHSPIPHAVLSVDLQPSGPTYTRSIEAFSTASSTTAVTFSGLPDEGVHVDARLQVVAGNRSMWTASSELADGPAWQRTLPAVTIDGYREHVAVYRDDPDTVMAHGYSLSTSTPRDAVTEDASDWLPMLRMTESIVDPAGRHRLSWEPLAPMPARVDGQVAFRYGWTLVMPPGLTSVVYPELPPEFVELSTRFPPSVNIKAIDAFDVYSYREFRSGQHAVRDQALFWGGLVAQTLAEAPERGGRWDWSYGRLTPGVLGEP